MGARGFMNTITKTGIALAVAALTAGQAWAQTTESGGDLRAQQERLFEQMFADPDNLDLMFQHALISIELLDYEAAISTLERMLIFNPQLSRAKVELGAAYFRLGAYENARYYFDDVLANDNPPPEVARRVRGFLDEIGRRTQETGATLVTTFGATYSSNANLGPSDNGLLDVLALGALSNLNDAFIQSDDVGIRATAAARHFIDLNQPDGDAWVTDASLFSLHYLDETQGDLDSFTIISGPRLSLDTQNYGPKLRPYLYGDFVTSGNELLYATAGVGAEYSDTISDEINNFAVAQSAWREYPDRIGFSGHTHKLAFGVAYTPDPSFTLTGSIFAETDRTESFVPAALVSPAQSDPNSNYEIGVRLGGTYRYDSGFEFTDRLWSLSGFVGATYRRFDEPNTAVVGALPLTREDVDYRAGLSHLFHLEGGWFVQADADYLLRDSNVRNFDIDNVGVALSIGRTF